MSSRLPSGAASGTRIHWIAAMAGCGPSHGPAPTCGPVHTVRTTRPELSLTSVPVTASHGGPPLVTCTTMLLPWASTKVNGVARRRSPATGSVIVGVGMPVGKPGGSGSGAGPGTPPDPGAEPGAEPVVGGTPPPLTLPLALPPGASARPHAARTALPIRAAAADIARSSRRRDGIPAECAGADGIPDGRPGTGNAPGESGRVPCRRPAGPAGPDGVPAIRGSAWCCRGPRRRRRSTARA